MISLTAFLEQATRDKVPGKAEMADALGLDMDEIVRAIVGASELQRRGNEFEALEGVMAVMTWGAALGYYYALKTYDEKLGLKP